MFIVLFNIIPFAASAEEDNHYYSFSQFRSFWGYSDSNYEFIFKYSIYDSDWDRYFYDTCGFSLSNNDFSNYVSECTMTNGLFTIIFNTSQQFHISEKSGSGYDDVPNNNSWYYTVQKLEFDTTNNILYLYDSNNNIINQDYAHHLNNDFHIVEYTCNIDEFALEDEYDVRVNFTPTLSGNVDREVTVNGSKSMLSSLTMTVENHCSFDIQYDMRIYKKFQQTHRSYDALTADDTFFDDDPIFMYYKNQWVYCTNYDDMNSFLNDDPVKENKPSYWHYLSSGATDTVTIEFSQLNFLEGEEYTVTLRAIKNNYGISSEQIVYLASSDPALSELYQLQGDDIQTVYTSDFVMINYNDVKYDPNNNNNGVLAYNGRNGQAARNNYQYSRNAREESNGTIDYSSRNLYTNQNSWLNQQRNTVIQNHSSYKCGSIPASLSNHFNSFLTFITSVFSKLPLDIQHIYIYGFVSIVVLGIILKVIK